MKNDASKKIQPVMEEILDLLKTISYGSLEVYVQDHVITQLTVRNIKKTKVAIKNVKMDQVLTV